VTAGAGETTRQRKNHATVLISVGYSVGIILVVCALILSEIGFWITGG